MELQRTLPFATARLSILMFLEFSTLAYGLIGSYYFTQVLHFSALQAGLLTSTFALGMLTSPWLMNLFSDKRISPAALLSILQGLSAVVLFAASSRTSFIPLFLLLMISSFLVAPTLGIANALCFRYGKSKEGFGFLRMWGTLGFVGFSWLVSRLWLNSFPGAQISDVYRFAALVSFLTAVYALTLPRERLAVTQTKGDVTRTIKKPVVIWLILLVALVLFFQRFYHLGAGPNLAYLGVSEDWMLPLLSGYQILEVGVLLSLSWLLKKVPGYILIFCGLFIQVTLFFILSLGVLPGLVTGLVLYGFKFPFVMVVAYMILDDQTSPQNQHDMHQIFQVLTFGFGELLGNAVAGAVLDHWQVLDRGLYSRLWGVLSLCSILFMIIVLISWRFVRKTMTPVINKT